MKEERCADERNTYWVCSSEFFQLASILTEKNELFESNSPEEALLLVEDTYLTNLRHVLLIIFLSVYLICKFYIYRNFYLL